MNQILEQIEQKMRACLQKVLPHVEASDLEKAGAIFYMNGKNGTAFDWFVNEHFPCFFIFYNDAENLGAVKALLDPDGALTVYVYGDKGHGEPICFEEHIEASADECLDLAVSLTENADNRRIWDADIRTLNTDGKPDRESLDRFLSLRDAHGPMIEWKKLLFKTAIVSKKVREEGWKIGFGLREEPSRDSDSGWFFCVGNEPSDTSTTRIIWSFGPSILL